MQFRPLLVAAGIGALLVATVGCSGGSSDSAGTDTSTDVILGGGVFSSGSQPASSSPSSSSSASGAPAASGAPTDTAPKVPPGAVMAATLIVDSGKFKGTSQIKSTGTVGCSYSLFGDQQWRISFAAEGEFASADTTSSGRPVIAFDVTTKKDGSADLGVTYTLGQDRNDLADSNGVATAQDDGANVTFTYAGRNDDGTRFHGAALCTKALRNP